ncbi:hypothetical protein GDO86_020051 [Hymenochirus boettgeri]|uniref:Sulfotransferase n=1 Tax=Hymenochirus boettgeri TaxID=247094 RepID=A0A8T2IG01_9PIPI|nr:hypothetical protein GDO86_020051 [Hymenochirus boettgeri]
MDLAKMEEMGKMENILFTMGHVEGVPLPGPTVDVWDSIYNFQAREDDVVIATYPKAGTTWMQEIMDLVLLEGDVERSMRAPCFIKVPFIEMGALNPMPSGVELAEKMESPRMIKTHLPVQLVPPSFWEKKVKIVYVARNAKDLMVSYYYFQRITKGLPSIDSWENYFPAFLSGDVPWGSWFDHVIGWWKAVDKHRILFVFYEDMMEDPKREVIKVMKFLGKDLSDDVVERIVDHTTFKAMKENPMTNFTSFPNTILDQTISPFMRKGTELWEDGWKNPFSSGPQNRFVRNKRTRLEGSRPDVPH